MDFINSIKLPILYNAFVDSWDGLEREEKAEIVMKYIDDIELELVNNKYKEIFKRVLEAVNSDKFAIFFERTRLLTDMVYNINFDTMKIYKSSLDNNEIPKEIKKRSASYSL